MRLESWCPCWARNSGLTVVIAIVTILLDIVLPSARAGDASPPLVRGEDFLTIVRNSGAGGYEAFPDIAHLNDGRLMVVHYAGYSHISMPNDVWPMGGRISYVLSSDEGMTWSEPHVLLDTPQDDRDPSIARLKDGRLICNFFNVPSGDVFVTTSADNGTTWNTEQMVTKRFATSSPVRQLASGRLVLPMYRSVALSDDQGKTWRTIEIPSATPEAAGVDLTEADVVELSDNQLYAVHRTDDGSPMRYTTSTDGGETWSQARSLSFQGHSPYLLLTKSNILVLGYRGVLEDDRFDTQLRYSKDNGKTWSDACRIDDLIGAYPSMIELDDGSVFVVYYEEGAGSDIRARRFRIDNDGLRWLKFDHHN